MRCWAGGEVTHLPDTAEKKKKERKHFGLILYLKVFLRNNNLLFLRRCSKHGGKDKPNQQEEGSTAAGAV